MFFIFLLFGLVADLRICARESFNGGLRDELLNETLFESLAQARRIIEEWRIDYNGERPHTSLNGLTPNEFATRSPKDDIPRLVDLVPR